MNREDILKVRDALWLPENSTDEEFAQFSEAFAILDRELAKPDPEPVVYWNGDRSVIPADEVSYIPNWTDYYPTPLYRHPAHQSAQPMQWIDVSERVPDEAQIVLFVLRGKVVVGAWIAGIFWYDNAKQVATAWMPLPPPPEFGVGGYPVTAPPSREWQGLSDEERQECQKQALEGFRHAIKTGGVNPPTIDVIVEAALRAKNSGAQA